MSEVMQPKMHYHFSVGDRVRSVAVGSKPSFVGVITEKLSAKTRDGIYRYFHVQDESDGTGWHRVASELEDA